METPTTTRRPAAAARAGFSSTRMMEAQRTFQSVVKHELQLLLMDGTKREEAVKLLLRRIVASTEPPEATAVRGVMRQFQMNYDDAMRALIVKQELGRLKRQGLDSFAAIEELTRKMKSREDETAREDEECEKEEDQVEEKEQKCDRKREEEGQMMNEVEQHKDVVLSEEKDKAILSQQKKKEKETTVTLAIEVASPTLEKDGNETSLSLCQRIGLVSISSGNTPEKELEEHDEEAEANENTDGDKARIKSTLRVRRPLNSTLADLTPQTRKRRAAFGMKYETSSNNCNNSGDCNVKPLYPNLKKQKLCAAVGDGFLEIVTLKSKSASATSSKSSSGAGISGTSPSGEKGGGPMWSDHSTKSLLKRPRASPTGMADSDGSPIAEGLHASHVHHRHHTNHHHSKRQKSGSIH